MKFKIIPLLLVLFISYSSSGQSQSELYGSPIDTLLFSKSLNVNKKVTVILPTTYSKENRTKFPLIIVFDRQNKGIFRNIFETINYLVYQSAMPESIIVGITSDNMERNIETSLSGSRKNGKGELTNAFVFNELIPFAEKNYNASKCRILIGHSRFGYFTTYLLSKNLNSLTGVISCSPLFQDTNVNLVDSLLNKVNTSNLSHHVFYRFITGDSITDTKDYAVMKNALQHKTQNKLFNWKGMEFYDANHMTTPGLGVMPSLYEIFSNWQKASSFTLTASIDSTFRFTNAYYQKFRAEMQEYYGDEIGAGLAKLNGIGYAHFNKKEYKNAREAWIILSIEYPFFVDSYISIGKTYLAEKNKKLAKKYFEKAMDHLPDNSFYTKSRSQEIRKDILEKIKQLSL